MMANIVSPLSNLVAPDVAVFRQNLLLSAPLIAEVHLNNRQRTAADKESATRRMAHFP
jgi:hypothetical protein